MWCPIEFCRAKWGRAKSYAFISKVLVSGCPSYDTILHWITIPSAPWCITTWTRLYHCTDTKLDGTLSWADNNRNGNRFFDLNCLEATSYSIPKELFFYKKNIEIHCTVVKKKRIQVSYEAKISDSNLFSCVKLRHWMGFKVSLNRYSWGAGKLP